MDLYIPSWAEIIVEGRARIVAPRRELFLREDGVYEPSHAPVFYNPAMVFNRDLMVALLNIYSKSVSRISTASDPMTATGVRGIRVALEVEGVSEIFLNDIDPLACRVARLNVVINSLARVSRIYCEDSNQHVISLSKSGIHVDFLDIDPYGSPAPFIESAVRLPKIGGLLAMTATDLGPLTGRYPAKVYRRYHAIMARDLDFGKEAGLRILIAHSIIKASERDIALKPVIAYYADHYYRAYFSIDRGASKADALLKGLGYITVCKGCGYRSVITETEDLRCPVCGLKMTTLGPLWLGSLANREILASLSRTGDEFPWLQTRERISSLAKTLLAEDDIDRPYYYRVDSIARTVKSNMPPINELIECLRSMGYRVSRTHFDRIGVRTDADFKDIASCIRSRGAVRQQGLETSSSGSLVSSSHRGV